MNDHDAHAGAGIPVPVLKRLLPAIGPGPVLYLGRDQSRMPLFDPLSMREEVDAVLFYPPDVVESHETPAERASSGDAGTDVAFGDGEARTRRGNGEAQTRRGGETAVASGSTPEKGAADTLDRDAGSPRTVRRWPHDRGAIELPELRYQVVLIDGVLSAMRPADGDRVLERVRQATRWGGIVFASALTTGDPQLERLRAVSEAVLRDTYEVDDRELVRFVAPGELAMAFDGWTLLHAVETAAAAGSSDPSRATSVVVARRPAGGTLLA